MARIDFSKLKSELAQKLHKPVSILSTSPHEIQVPLARQDLPRGTSRNGSSAALIPRSAKPIAMTAIE